PYSYQKEIIEKLRTEREVHGRYRNLLVAATGTGKTIISSFDFKEFKRKNPNAKLLFIAHREEILKQAVRTFRGVLKDNNFGDLWVGRHTPVKYSQLFASVQTLTNKIEELRLSPDYYDFIIIDEVHHIAASSYRPILNYFKPKILLGLTATPERSNEKENILDDFCNKIGAEIRLPQALNKKLLCPFQYFGIATDEDLTKITWKNGRYIPSELSQLYISTNNQVRNVISNLEKYTKDINDVCALCFCVTIEHAKFMSNKFNEAGLKSGYLTSSNSSNRSQLKSDLLNKEINYLFVVDIFNEGVDIPQIDTVLFLRPTESLTVFLQQLGRGLRLAEDKDCLTVLDFVGNARPEYDFENKFRALIGKTSKPVSAEVEQDFPHLPIGCSIILEEKVKTTILENIRSATNPRRSQLLNRIKNFQFQTNIELTLQNFVEFTELPLELIYKKGSWNRLLVDAGIIEDYEEKSEKIIERAISKNGVQQCLRLILTLFSSYVNPHSHLITTHLLKTKKRCF
ncbi:MAG: DEAD/DEAH box helicase family protein, partial [Bacteroidia bacterium]